MWLIDNIIGPAAAIASWCLLTLAMCKWGLSGIAERQCALIHRLAHGPRTTSRVDYARIERLERELFGE